MTQPAVQIPNVAFAAKNGIVSLNQATKTITFAGQGGSVVGVTATVETAGEITRRVTATRILATGVFALALKKKKDDRELYLIVEGETFSFAAECDPKQGSTARQFAAAINTVSKEACIIPMN